MEFNKEELSHYDGKEGRPAYVAIDGIVYDVTNVEPWAGGEHHGNVAGVDNSEAIRQSPHGLSVLEKLKQVGTYSEEHPSENYEDENQ